MTTPIRAALVEKSNLLPLVKDGLNALKPGDRELLDVEIRSAFADSLDLDAATQAAHPNANRWDYLLGHGASNKIVGVEPHTANNHEIKTVVAKRQAALDVLAPHFRNGKRVAAWLWVTAGKVDFLSVDKARLALDQRGIEFAGRRVQGKHLRNLTEDR